MTDRRDMGLGAGVAGALTIGAQPPLSFEEVNGQQSLVNGKRRNVLDALCRRFARVEVEADKVWGEVKLRRDDEERVMRYVRCLRRCYTLRAAAADVMNAGGGL